MNSYCYYFTAYNRRLPMTLVRTPPKQKHYEAAHLTIVFQIAFYLSLHCAHILVDRSALRVTPASMLFSRPTESLMSDKKFICCIRELEIINKILLKVKRRKPNADLFTYVYYSTESVENAETSINLELQRDGRVRGSVTAEFGCAHDEFIGQFHALYNVVLSNRKRRINNIIYAFVCALTHTCA